MLKTIYHRYSIYNEMSIFESCMKSLLHTPSTKKFVVPSVAVIMTLASTMFMAPVFAVGIFLDQSLQTNSDGSLTATYRARGFAGTPPGAEVFLTSNVEVEFKCTNPNAEGNDQPQTRETTIELKGESDNFDMGSNDGEVSLGPPSAEDLCHTSKLNVEIESITYNDVVLHAIPNDPSQPEVTHDFGDVGPIVP
jgi:hypothetical protein